jgi:putative methionine-R-sulfoxide reductase with GAF domain
MPARAVIGVSTGNRVGTYPKNVDEGQLKMKTPEDLGARIPDLIVEIESILHGTNGGSDPVDRLMHFLHREIPQYTWVGVYIMEGDELVLGPFRGKPSPHTRIPLNQGICGAAASTGETVIVPDVNADPRYLACSLETRSEIVVPILDGDNACLGEIDIDSDIANAFSEVDQRFLEEVAARLAPVLAARQ